MTLIKTFSQFNLNYQQKEIKMLKMSTFLGLGKEGKIVAVLIHEIETPSRL